LIYFTIYSKLNIKCNGCFTNLFLKVIYLRNFLGANMERNDLMQVKIDDKQTKTEPPVTNEELLLHLKELKITNNKLTHMAYYDSLTELPNKVLFSNRLINGIESLKFYDTKMVILFIDLDNFKIVNDTLGHALGDELLKEAASRLQSSTRECDFVARISGDEFSVLIQNMDKISNVISIIERILNAFGKPFCIGNSSINMSASIGASIYPDDGILEEDLLRSADIAMYKAKELGKNGYQFFNVSMKNELLKKLNIEVMLRKAIKQDEFELHYQPQFDVKSRKLRGYEALIRWNSPELGYLYPGEFISIAEETGLILAIGEWVLNTACALGSEINTKHGSNLIVAVNISPIQLRQTKFYDVVIKAINNSGIKPENLELEVTENIFINNFDAALKVLNNLRQYGVRIALDDFGIGFSSLSYLKKLPINLLKIDKSFISEIDDFNSENKMAGSIISLVHNLNIETLAEGVEKEVQLEYLMNSNCDILQGYYLSRPISKVELVQIVKDNFSLL
jgi:diguanylate cyclase (GGDEF)-like protein